MVKSVEFGILLHTRQLVRENGEPGSFGELSEGAAMAEEMGFDHVWLGDSDELKPRLAA